MASVIEATGLGKKYILRHSSRGRSDTLRDALTASARELGRRILHFSDRGSSSDPLCDEFWALKDVFLEIRQGDRFGLIGRNGAGKSTLLKILSRITLPSEGKVRIRGRVATLLEVGTGFHPELTGRENLFLNGAILGMRGAEIRKKFDSIVEFAEVERFLDTPVKRYSSGMYVRLAFAVAAHLEPEILLIDEVLAVGDAQFQKKCLGKMEDLGKEGRTILFVSHNLAAVESLCNRAVVLRGGTNGHVGTPREVIREYLEEMERDIDQPIAERRDRTGKGRIFIRDIRFEGARSGNVYEIGEDIRVRLTLVSRYDETVNARLAVSIRTAAGSPLIVCDSLQKGEIHEIPGGRDVSVTCRICAPSLNLGEYHVNVAVFHGNEAEDWLAHAARFSIASGSFQGFVNYLPFPILSAFEWKVEP